MKKTRVMGLWGGGGVANFPCEALPGVWGSRGIWPFISGEQENKSLQLKGRQFWGTGNRENQDFDPLGNKGKCRFFFRGTREQSHWEGLILHSTDVRAEYSNTPRLYIQWLNSVIYCATNHFADVSLHFHDVRRCFFFFLASTT